MAKSLSYPKITVETATERYEFNAEHASISSMDSGVTHCMSTGPLRGMKKTILPEAPHISAAAFLISEPALSEEQQAGLKTVAQRAKAIEGERLMGARAVEEAILEAHRLTDLREHQFNISVLEALHTGLTTDQLQDHLESLNLGSAGADIGAVQRLDTAALYGV